ncbi:MAG: hypothetical protein LC656_03105 [Sphingomonadales bacterium]|nr:hypothetical protein [Sphingomonadales bacterium]
MRRFKVVRALEHRPHEGDERLSGSDKAEARDGDRTRGVGEGKSVATKKKLPSRPADVGRALRSVYDDTLREDIPSDLKDLLGRLG